MSAKERRGGLEVRLPAAVLRVWVEGPNTLAARVNGLAVGGPGVHAAGSGVWAVLPEPGRPAVFDAAVELGGRLLAALADEVGLGKARALIVPAAVAVGPGGRELLDDRLLEEIRARPPQIAPDAVHLSTHAALALEGRWATAAASSLDSG